MKKKVLLFIILILINAGSVRYITFIFFRSYSLLVSRQSISGISNANRPVTWGLLCVLMCHTMDIIVQ